MRLATIPAEAKQYKHGNYIRVEGVVGHPLADSRGRVALHRIVCWEALGQPLESACHWCDYVLPWKSTGYRYCINVDHLDNDTSNNDASNLRPSCFWCNASRSWGQHNTTFWAALVQLTAALDPNDRPSLNQILITLTRGLDERHAATVVVEATCLPATEATP